MRVSFVTHDLLLRREVFRKLIKQRFDIFFFRRILYAENKLLVRAKRPPVALLDIDPRKAGRTRQGRPIIPVEAFKPGSALVLGAVGARGAREKIRERLLAWNLRETEDFWMVA